MGLRKRVFVFLLALVVVLTFAPVTASAETVTESDDEDSENSSVPEIIMWWIVLAASALGVLFTAIWYSVRRRKVKMQRRRNL